MSLSLFSFQRWFDFSAINEDDGNERIIEQEREHQVLQRLHAVGYLLVLIMLRTQCLHSQSVSVITVHTRGNL